MIKATDIQLLIKTCEPAIREYIIALEAENLKLQKQVAKLQVNEVSLKNRITALEQEIKKHGGAHEKITRIELVAPNDKTT